MSNVYWKIYHPPDDEPCIVCMQWFDEPDYNDLFFVTGKKFDTEEHAQNWLSEYLQPNIAVCPECGSLVKCGRMNV